MAAKNTAPKETSQALIITMVFFILVSIGLGVATYFGFAEQEKLRGDAKAAAGKEKKANDERDFYRFQAWLLRAYIGQPFQGVGDDADKGKKATEQLASDKGKMTANQMDKGLSDERKRELEDFKALVTKDIEVAGKCGTWNVDQAKPEKTYEELLKAEREEVARLQTSLRDANAEVAKARAAQKAAEDNLQANKTMYATKLTEIGAEKQADLDNYNKEVAKYLALYNQVKDKKSPNADAFLAEKEQAIKDRNLMAKELKELREKVGILQSRLDRKEDEKPVNAKILGEIVGVQVSGKKAYINLGSAHGLKPQQTFSVYALDPNGKPHAEPKASVEVINVVKDRLSEVIITTMYSKERDPYTDRLRQIDVASAKNINPVVKGDVLINPVWNPDAKVHVAITGVIDLKGEGFDNADAFIRALEKQNVIVDAYIDPRDMTIKGPGISQKTEYLIIGDQPFTSDPTGKSQKAENLIKRMDEMRIQSNKYGLTSKKLTKFLEETGYRLEKRVEN